MCGRFRVIRGDDALQSRGLDTLTEARAPSTRCLYALKWGVFVKWCGQAHIDPVTCTVSDVLSFLQYRLDSGSLTSTLEVYVAAITAFRSPQSGQSFGNHALMVSFLKGAKRLTSPTSAFSSVLGPRGGVKSSLTATI